MVIEVRKVVLLVMKEGVIDWKRHEGTFWSVGDPRCLHLTGSCQASTYTQTHCRQADMSVSASSVYSYIPMNKITVPKAGRTQSQWFPFLAMPDPLYSGDTEILSASITHLYLPPQVCLYPQVIFISAATSIYLNLERRGKCYMCVSIYRIVYFFQRTGGS